MWLPVAIAQQGKGWYLGYFADDQIWPSAPPRTVSRYREHADRMRSESMASGHS